MYKSLENIIETHKYIILDCYISASNKSYHESVIKKYKSFIQLLKNGEMTPEIFGDLGSREKWEIYKILKGKVDWFCAKCGVKHNPSGTFTRMYCDECDNLLTHRTGGGMGDSFNWTFKYNLKETRRIKLLNITTSTNKCDERFDDTLNSEFMNFYMGNLD
jgi:hypothetical protein